MSINGIRTKHYLRTIACRPKSSFEDNKNDTQPEHQLRQTVLIEPINQGLPILFARGLPHFQCGFSLPHSLWSKNKSWSIEFGFLLEDTHYYLTVVTSLLCCLNSEPDGPCVAVCTSACSSGCHAGFDLKANCGSWVECRESWIGVDWLRLAWWITDLKKGDSRWPRNM